jgi:GAF domain-containing protein/HAMP domain-containing protein
LLGTVAVVALALGVTILVNARTLQTDLREEIGAEFESLARAQMSHLADILSEQLTILRSITLIDQVKEDVATASTRYSGDQAAIEAQLLAIDEQWLAAADDSQLVQSIVDPQSNLLTFQILDFMEAFPDHVELFLTDRYGGLLAATGRTSDYYQADEDWWQVAYNAGRGAFYIGQPEYDESAGYTALNMAAPIISESGEVIGIARTTFRVDAIYQAVGRVQFGETGQVTVIDSAGLVVADTYPERVGAQVPPSWGTPEMLQMASHWHELVDEEGVPILTGHATISGIEIEHEDKAKAIRALGWVLFVTQSQAEAYAPVASATLTGFVAIGVFALIAAGLAFVVARTVVTPITDLVGVTRQMAAGDLSARARLRRRDETGELAEAFNRMADEIAGMVGTLEQRVAERTRGLQAAAEVSRATTSVLDPDELLHQTVDLVRERFNLYYVGLFLLDEERRFALLQAGTGEAGQKMLAQGHELEVGGDSMIGQCVANAEARIALDVGEEAVRFDNPLLPETRSEMALPLRSRGRVIGAMTVQSTEEAAFDEAHIAVMQTMADQVAVAIDNALLFVETQAALEETEVTHRRYLGQAWTGYARTRAVSGYEQTDTGLKSLSKEVLPQVQQAMAEQRPVVWNGDPWAGSARSPSTPRLRSGQTPRHALRQAQDEARDDAGSGRSPSTLRPRSGHSGDTDSSPPALVAPIMLRGQPIGALGFRGEGRQWSDDDIALAEAIAEQLALAADNLRLLDETQRRAAHERLTGEVTARMRETLDMETVLKTAVDEMYQALGLDEIVIRLATEETDEGSA